MALCKICAVAHFGALMIATFLSADVLMAREITRSQLAAISVESSSQRAALPPFKVIPAAEDSEITPAAADPPGELAWSRSNANAANARYSPLSQIDLHTVSALRVAWVYHSKDGKGNIQANPVIVDGVIYAPTVGRHIVAIDGTTGQELWRSTIPLAPSPPDEIQDVTSSATSSPEANEWAASDEAGYGPAQRGLVYWPGDQRHGPRLYFGANGYLIALDSRTGAKVDNFGDHGIVRASKGAGTSAFLGAPAPAIYRNVIVAANQNFVDAFDVASGDPLWHFDTLTYPVAAPKEDNGGNVWGGIALDLARGIAFVAVGDPHPNFVGVDRAGRNEHTCSVVALDIRTGRLLWSFQEVAHNLWDLDVPAPPNLVTIWRHGKRVDAVAEVTKLGNVLLLDRLSGKPLFPYRLRRAPISTVPGESTWPYQPDLELPQPFARQVFTLDDVTDISPDSHAFILNKIRHAAFGWFEPPHVGKPIVLFGIHGGAEWTGASFDPSTGWLYVSANEIPWIESLSVSSSHYQSDVSKALTPGERVYRQHCAICHGENRQGRGMAPPLTDLRQRLTESQIIGILTGGRNSMPPIVLPENDERKLLDSLLKLDVAPSQAVATDVSVPPSYEASGFDKLLDNHDYPGSKPPWGTLNAIDLNTGRLVWKVPLGEYDELTRQHIPRTGTENFGGAMVTGGGLVFCAGTRDLNIRAFDKATGAELWHHKLPYGGYAPPATYSVGGRQYVVIAATGGGKLGGELGDAYVAFALPDTETDTKTH